MEEEKSGNLVVYITIYCRSIKRGTGQIKYFHFHCGNIFTEMNFLYPILISCFVFLRIPGVDSGSESISAESYSSHAGPSDSNRASVGYRHLSNVKINIVISPDHHKHLHLKLVYRVLANEHLPVWVMRNKADTESSEDNVCGLEYLPWVMKQLGGFSFYQDTETSSAAVYYHRRGEFDGMIDSKYLIQGLSIEKIHESAKTKIRLGESGIISREESIDHPPTPLQFQNADRESKNPSDEIRSTYGNHLYSGYPEILVFVSCSLARELLFEDKNHPDRYTPLISHILTLFNGVDMLYSKLEGTIIKLNIAGIIIENECGALSFFKNCYDHSYDENGHHRLELLDAVCVIEKLELFLSDCQPAIPIDAYDVTVFLTRTGLYRMVDGKLFGLDGLSHKKGVYDERLLHKLPGLIATVLERKHFRSHGVIAHELAHLMKVPHDVPLFVNDEECCQNIMKLEGTYWCEKCLSWSQQSEQLFKRFFSSADCCVFTNTPRSLYAPGPRQMLTADEQCRCYGYRSAKIIPMPADAFCVSDMSCEDDNSKIHRSLIPLAGTPCAFNKVCWDYACNVIPY